MENQIIRTKIVQRENNKETCAALEMTEEEFQKIISIYGKGEPTIRELKPYSERLQEAQKATLPGEELKEQNFETVDTDGFEKTVILLWGWITTLQRELTGDKGLRIEIKYDPKALKTQLAVYTPTKDVSDGRQTGF